MSSQDLSELSAWFEQRVLENYRLFFSIAYQILRDQHEAEEATQDAVLKAWNRLGELHDPASLVGWVARIARNTALDRRRRPVQESVDEAFLDALHPAVDAPMPLPDQQDDRASLLREIGELPDGQAVVVTLRFFEGLDIRQIAGRLGVMENAVRVRLHRGLENLRRRPRLRAMSGVDS